MITRSVESLFCLLNDEWTQEKHNIFQIFSVPKGEKLKSMLLPFLVDLENDQLKLLCLDQLVKLKNVD